MQGGFIGQVTLQPIKWDKSSVAVALTKKNSVPEETSRHATFLKGRLAAVHTGHRTFADFSFGDMARLNDNIDIGFEFVL